MELNWCFINLEVGFHLSRDTQFCKITFIFCECVYVGEGHMSQHTYEGRGQGDLVLPSIL